MCELPTRPEREGWVEKESAPRQMRGEQESAVVDRMKWTRVGSEWPWKEGG